MYSQAWCTNANRNVSQFHTVGTYPSVHDVHVDTYSSVHDGLDFLAFEKYLFWIVILIVFQYVDP